MQSWAKDLKSPCLSNCPWQPTYNQKSPPSVPKSCTGLSSPCHFPWCMVGQDLHHNTLWQHSYNYKELVDTKTHTHLNILMCTGTLLVVLQCHNSVMIHWSSFKCQCCLVWTTKRCCKDELSFWRYCTISVWKGLQSAVSSHTGQQFWMFIWWRMTNGVHGCRCVASVFHCSVKQIFSTFSKGHVSVRHSTQKLQRQKLQTCAPSWII